MLNCQLNLRQKMIFFHICTAEDRIRNFEKIINKTLDLLTPKNSSKTKKDETGLPAKLKMLVPRNKVFGIIFCSPCHKKQKTIQPTEQQNKNISKKRKKELLQKKFDKRNDSNGQSFYRHPNQIFHPNPKRKSEITNTIDSETLKNFFVNIGPSLSKKIEKPYNGKMINRVVCSFVLKPLQNEEANFELKHLVGKKSSDYMGLTNHLLKTINAVISGYLRDIFKKNS